LNNNNSNNSNNNNDDDEKVDNGGGGIGAMVMGPLYKIRPKFGHHYVYIPINNLRKIQFFIILIPINKVQLEFI
jgi:hypothetical protein